MTSQGPRLPSPMLTFLGAARTVTGSKYLVQSNGHRLLVDCGLFQGGRKVENYNRLPRRGPLQRLDAVGASFQGALDELRRATVTFEGLEGLVDARPIDTSPPHAVIATALPLLVGGPKRLAHGVFSTLVKQGAHLPPAPTLPEAVTMRWGERAESIGMSLSSFERKFSAIFGQSPTQYLQQVRIHAARAMIERDQHELAHIARACGFYDQSQLGKVFKRFAGMTPAQYRAKMTTRSASFNTGP